MKAFVVGIMVVILLAAFVSVFADKKPASITIPKYTVVPVILDDTISTKRNTTGDKFEVHCADANNCGFPKGTTFVGVLTVTPAKGHEPGRGSAKFTHAILPDDREIHIVAEPCSAEGIKVGEKSGGTSKSKAQTTGAAVGAGIGFLVAGGHGGAIVGGAVGAVAGGTSKGEGKNIEIKAGSKGYIVFLKTVTIPPPTKKSSSHH
jgi:hypothetical protein